MSIGWKRLAVAAASTGFALLTVEVGLRVRAHLENENTLSEALAGPQDPAADEPARMRHITRFHENDKIAYELRPDLDLIVEQGKVPTRSVTNRHGFRGPDVAPDKPPGTLRILGLGDSVMYGWGIEASETYLSVLVDELNARHPERRWEAVNTAVPGYNTVQEVETLRVKGLAFAPDLVILGLSSNDFDLPPFFRESQDVLALDRCFVLDLFRDAGRRRDPAWSNRALQDVPPHYRGLLGPQAFLGAIDELAALRDAAGFEVVALGYQRHEAVQRMLGTAARAGFLTVEGWVTVGRHVTEQGLATEVLSVSAKDPHPSALHHRLLAEALLEALEREGVVARLMDV